MRRTAGLKGGRRMEHADLGECRKKLDEIDAGIVRLFEERMDVCRDVAESKIESRRPVYDAEREKAKIDSVEAMVSGDFDRLAVKDVFSELMTLSRRLQYGILAQNGITESTGYRQVDELQKDRCRVVFQGVEGAYSHEATLQFFGRYVDAYHVPEFEDTMCEVADGRADYAVLPAENSTAGFVSNNYDLLLDHDIHIVGEVYIPVNHMLLGVPGAELSDIRTVYSHDQALMQSAEFLDSHREWDRVSVANTAVAAQKVMNDGDKTQAAIASRTAAQLYGLDILAEGVNTEKGNTTRFFVLAKEPVYSKSASKISIAFEIPHKSGSLYNIIGNFIFNDINMTMIESRPVPERPFEYRFFIDFEGNLSDPAVINALTGLKAETTGLKILGNYQSSGGI